VTVIAVPSALAFASGARRALGHLECQLDHQPSTSLESCGRESCDRASI
jgi:hypothetical protein